MELKSNFETFLKEIRPTENQRNDYKTGHSTLRDRLNGDADLKDIIVSTFLQGSYRRATAVRPKNGKRADVDIIVVTKLSKEEYEPDAAMDVFEPFLKKWYDGKYRRQGRSIGIELSYIDMDLVITSAPSKAEEGILKTAAVTTDENPDEARDWKLVESWLPMAEREFVISKSLLLDQIRKEEEWKAEPLWIPNRDAGNWEKTDPLEQIKWTWGKNARCNTHYINVVKALKWWQRAYHEDDRPKGYPLEHLIGYCCPDNINSVAEGVTKTLETIVNTFSVNYIFGTVPTLPDHGVPEHNVLGRVNGEEFKEFYGHAKDAAALARTAFDHERACDSSKKWRELFGDKFPLSEDDDDGNRSDTKGPFIPPFPKSQTGDLTPRKYGGNDNQ